MTITNGYATLAEFKGRFFPAGVTDNVDDQGIEGVMEAACRLIDERCGRFFYSAAQTRYYTPDEAWELRVDDLVSITTLKTDEDGDRVYETAWATTDYDLEPFNAALMGKPYTRIRTSPNGSYAFPELRKGVELVGTFGWPAVPKLAKEVCLLQAHRVWRRKDAPFGVTGSAELGQLMVISRLDPDVIEMLQPLYREGW